MPYKSTNALKKYIYLHTLRLYIFDMKFRKAIFQLIKSSNDSIILSAFAMTFSLLTCSI